MLERQRDGIARAKGEGRYKGRVPTVRRQAAEIIRLKESGVGPSEIAVHVGYWTGQRLSGAWHVLRRGMLKERRMGQDNVALVRE